MGKNTLNLFFILSFLFLIVSCNKETNDAAPYQCPMKCESDKTYAKEGNCPVCKMDLKPIEERILHNDHEDEILETSIFNLTSKWNTQNNETIELKDLKGDVLVVVMIYTTCKAALSKISS